MQVNGFNSANYEQQAREVQNIVSQQNSTTLNTQSVIQAEVLKDTTNGSDGLQREMMTLIANTQPEIAARETARRQLSQGYLDVKV